MIAQSASVCDSPQPGALYASIPWPGGAIGRSTVGNLQPYLAWGGLDTEAGRR